MEGKIRIVDATGAQRRQQVLAGSLLRQTLGDRNPKANVRMSLKKTLTPKARPCPLGAASYARNWVNRLSLRSNEK